VDDGRRQRGTSPVSVHPGYVLVAVLLLAVNLRAAVTAMSPLLPRITPVIGLSGTEVGLLGALPPFCFAASALLGPVLLRRLPAERLAILALGLAAAGQLVRPWSGTAPTFLGLSVLALFGMGLGNVILPVLVKAWFPRWLGRITGFYVTAMVLGTAVPPVLAVPLADAVAAGTGSALTGWRVALATWAAFAGVAALPWLLTAAHPRTGAGAAPPSLVPSSGQPPVPSSGNHSGPSIASSRTAWGVMLIFGVNSLNSYALFAWLPVRLVDAGLTEATAGTVVALFAVVGVPAALLVPVIAARMRHQFPLVVAFSACWLTGLLGLLLAPAQGTLLWAAITGAGGAGFPLALTLIGLRTRDPVMAGRLSGFAQGVGYLGAGFGPLAVGALYDLTGTWGAPFAVLLFTVLPLLLGGWLAGRPRTVEDDLGVAGRGEDRIPFPPPDTLGR
jgi:MFS transporter, CP family, cyanate transporter